MGLPLDLKPSGAAFGVPGALRFDPHDRQLAEAAQRHAMEEYPNEACGAVTAQGYVPLRNRHPDPLHNFDCMEDAEPLLISGALLGLLHTHPDGPEGPSQTDIAQQIATGVPWGITLCTGAASAPPYFWGDGIPLPPVEGRPFRHGPSGTDGKGDCYAVIRDWYLTELGVRLPEAPRHDNWWEAGGDLYRDNFLSAGFVVVNREAPCRGDVFLMQVLAKVPNHGAIYLGGGMILHHLPKRLSRIEPSINWNGHVCERIRYVGT